MTGDQTTKRLPYEKPIILRHQVGLANKFGAGVARPTLGEIDGVACDELLEEHGSPLFVFSERTIRRRYREALRAFTLRYPNVQFAWSYKTNYLDAICQIYHQEGSTAEVVSEYEYDMARRLGIPGRDIRFNGPMKSREVLERTTAEGADIHVDGFDELYALEEIAKERGKPIGITLRLNMDTGIHPQWTRFGFNLESGEALSAIRRMHAGGHLKLTGLHTHIGTFILDPNAYGVAAGKLAALAIEAEQKYGFVVESLDLGGGFASKSVLHSQYAEDVPTVDEYAEAITSALLEAGFPAGRLPKLVLESGRGLIDEAGTLLTRVIQNRRLPTGVRAIDIDGGVNILFTAYWYRMNVVPTRDPGGLYEESIVYGPLCMNIDVVRPQVLLPPLDVGDALAVYPVGAYNVTQWMQFIRMRPAVVLVGEDGAVDVIRVAEDLDAVKRYERLPERLRPRKA